MADEENKYRRALENIDDTLRRYVPHLRGDDRASWALAEEIRSALTSTGIPFAGASLCNTWCDDDKRCVLARGHHGPHEV